MKTDIEKWLTKEGDIYLKEIGVKKGHVVVDFGCNVGHYTIPAAKVVGNKGMVYAVDKDREALIQLIKVTKSEGIENIVPLTTSGEFKSNLDNKCADVVLLYDILHYLTLVERKELYTEIYRILKNSGLLSIYPKHRKLDEPLWELSNMELESIINEVKKANFCLKGKYFKKLLHNDNYNTGYILNFTPKRKP
jgi:ubiquinone/menaquinone biosynthesis C-methylase UbiE